MVMRFCRIIFLEILLVDSFALSASSSHSTRTSFTGIHSHRAAILCILGFCLPGGNISVLLKEVLDTLWSHLGGLYLGGGEEDDGAEDDRSRSPEGAPGVPGVSIKMMEKFFPSISKLFK
jgi:hypothetical protein